MTVPRITVLIVAAGRGTRLGAGIPKQYRPLMGRSVLAHTIAGVRKALPGASITCVIAAGDEAVYAAAVGPDAPPTVTGGATRQDSVRNGLEALATDTPDIVLIHDAARPFGIEATAGPLLYALTVDGIAGAAPGIEVPDSLRRTQNGQLVTVDRDGLWRVQTPQAFRFQEILSAHRQAKGQSMTDDLSVAEAAGLNFTLIPGSPDALKITTQDDLDRARALLISSRADVRVGHGYDVHAFAEGDSVMLCGVSVPHSAALAGHSDADVGLHALTDAILGTIGAGDIGVHFPPSEPRWRGASSDTFLRHAAKLVTDKDGLIAHVDVTIVCEAPKITPHRPAMTRKIAELLNLDEDRVSVKATTTEGLGFTGRREGIAAYATATVRLPA